MPDPNDFFGSRDVGLTAPGQEPHRPDFSSSDADLPFVTRFIVAGADGEVTVDTPKATQVAILVTQGVNPVRISKVYTTGSDAITIDCWQ